MDKSSRNQTTDQAADRSAVALALDELDRGAARLALLLGGVRALDGESGPDFEIALMRLQTRAAEQCTQLADGLLALNTARKARAQHAAAE